MYSVIRRMEILMKRQKRFAAETLVLFVYAVMLSVNIFADDTGYYSSDGDRDAVSDEISIITENVPAPSDSGGEPGIEWDVNAEEIDDLLSGFLSLMGSGTRLTPTGNMTLVDDILQDESYVVQDKKVVKDKQFITVETKNGNYFYIIIDRSGEKENVYFLNLVDESDLLALLEDEKKEEPVPECTCKVRCEPGKVDTDCTVCRTNMSECTGKETVKPAPEKEEKTEETETEKTEEPKEKKSSGSLLAIVLILALAGGGALCWFKFRKKQPDTKGSSDLDDYDFGDDEDEYEIEEETADDDNDESKGE